MHLMVLSRVKNYFILVTPWMAIAACTPTPSEETAQHEAETLVNHNVAVNQLTVTIEPPDGEQPQGQQTIMLPVDPVEPLDTPVYTERPDGSISIYHGNSQQKLLTATIDCIGNIKTSHNPQPQTEPCAANAEGK